MQEIGVDMSRQRAKGIDRLMRDLGWVIIVCPTLARHRPMFPPVVTRLYWPLDDPTAAVGDAEQQLAAFRRVRNDIVERIERFVAHERASGRI
jgi:arsenate reductase